MSYICMHQVSFGSLSFKLFVNTTFLLDKNTPIEDTLQAIQKLYEMKKFKYFGLSNYPAWEVVYIWGYCKIRGWVLPSVYQGMYNPITRDIERESIPALQKLGISFYAYNPLCGGLLTGKHNFESMESSSGTRFDKSNEMYLSRYWNREVNHARLPTISTSIIFIQYFDAIEVIRSACDAEGCNVRCQTSYYFMCFS